MSVLDAILVKEMVSAPTTVNTDFVSDVAEIDNRQDAFTIQIVYDGGSSVSMDLVLQMSTDGINFSDVKTRAIVDDTGSHIFDVQDTGTRYARIGINVGSGSIDVQRIIYSGRRNH
jgi:hypothetical protein